VKTINISEFRQNCLGLVDELPSEGILITRHGKPVAKVVPIRSDNAALIGILKGELGADPNDDLFSTGEKWDAES
jgi:prevent-host-death family protein